jgi:hypothetical protein
MLDETVNSPGAYPEFANVPEGGVIAERPDQTLGAIDEAQSRIDAFYPEEEEETTEPEPQTEVTPEVTQEEINYKAYQKTIEQFKNLGLNSDEEILAYTQKQQQPEAEEPDYELSDVETYAEETETVPFANQQLAQYLEDCEPDDPLIGVTQTLDARLQALEQVAQSFQTQQVQYQQEQVNMQLYQELQSVLPEIAESFKAVPGSQPNMTPEQKAAEVIWTDVQQVLASGQRPDVKAIAQARQQQFNAYREAVLADYNAERGMQFAPARQVAEPNPVTSRGEPEMDISKMTTPDEFANAAAAILGGNNNKAVRRFK